MKTSDLGIKLPIVTEVSVTKLEPDGIAVAFVYAATRKRYQEGRLEHAYFGLTPPLARELLQGLRAKVK